MGDTATTPTKRYEELGLKLSLNRINRCVEAFKELSYYLRHAYSKSPKNLQSLIFEDILSAFRLLPQMQTQNAISAANTSSREQNLTKTKEGFGSFRI